MSKTIEKLVIEEKPETTIEDIAAIMWEIHKGGIESIVTSFKGISITSNAASSVEEIIERWEEKRKRNIALYEAECKAKFLDAVEKFDSLDLTSIPDVVEWLGSIAEGHMEVPVNYTKIAHKLISAGYEIYEVEGHLLPAEALIYFNDVDYFKSGKDLYAMGKYFIGQCLRFLVDDAPPARIVANFAKIYTNRLDYEKTKNACDSRHILKLN